MGFAGKDKLRHPSPTEIPYKSLGIPNGIWNLDLKSGIFGNLCVFSYNQ